MQSIQNPSFLPKITLKSLQQKLSLSHSKHLFGDWEYKKSCSPYFSGKVQGSQSRSTHQDIHIQSPFYPKQCRKFNCECLYHRRKRQILTKKIDLNKSKSKSPMRNFLLQMKKQQADIIRSQKIANAIQIANIQNERMHQKKGLIQSIKTYRVSQRALNQAIEQNSQGVNTLIGKIYNEIVHNKGNQFHHHHRNKNCVVNRNVEYQKFLKSRQLRKEEKQLMLKTLVAFLKHKVKQLEGSEDPQKMQKLISNYLLQSNLGVLLNHHNIGQLISRQLLQKLSRNDWIRIIKMLRVSQQQAFIVFDYLKEIFAQMRERGDNQHNKQQINNDIRQQQNGKGQQKYQNDSDHSQVDINSTYRITNNSKFGKSKIQNLGSYQKSLNKALSKSTSLSLNNPFNNSFSGNKTDQTIVKDEDSLKNSSKSNNLNKQNGTFNKENKRKDHGKKNQPKFIKKNSFESDTQFILQRCNSQKSQENDDEKQTKSIFILDSSQKQSSKKTASIGSLAKVKTRLKKGILKPQKQPPKPSKFDQLQHKIKYQKYCSKENFKVLIDVIDDSQIPLQQKLQRAFQTLKIQSYFGLNMHNMGIDTSKQKDIQKLMNQFQPLINGDFRQKMYRFIAVKRGNKLLDKLYKQIDRGLAKLQSFPYPDFKQYEKEQGSFSKMLANAQKQKIVNLIQQQQKDELAAYNRFPQPINKITGDSISLASNTTPVSIYNSKVTVTALDSVQETRTQKQLWQRQMGSAVFRDIDPNVTKVIIHKSKLLKTGPYSQKFMNQSDFQSPKLYVQFLPKLRFTVFDQQKQKEILKYARRFHQKQFKSVLRELSVHNSPQLSRVI